MNNTLKTWTHGLTKKVGPGPFAESCIVDVCHSKGLTYHVSVNKKIKASANIKIPVPNFPNLYGNQKSFRADGFIENHPIYGDLYVESKMYAFNSEGTANEKIAGFLDKAKHYPKPVLLVLGGEFELNTCFESNCIMAAANLLTPTDYFNSVNNTFIGKNTDELIKSGKLKVCKLSELINFL
jgi:hypothetical protein